MKRSRKPSAQTLLVLRCLAEAGEAWRHGLEISRACGLKSGVLYPILMRLADQGLMHDRWEASPHPGRPQRHLYRLTAQGQAYLAEHAPAAPAWAPVPLGAW